MLQENHFSGTQCSCCHGAHFSLTVGTRCLLRCSMFISSSNVRLRESKVTCNSRRVCFHDNIVVTQHRPGSGAYGLATSGRTRQRAGSQCGRRQDGLTLNLTLALPHLVLGLRHRVHAG